MRFRVIVALSVFVLLDVIGIGLLLAQQGASSNDEARRLCEAQVGSTRPSDLGPCLRSKVSGRDVGTSRAVILVPVTLGLAALAGVVVVARSRRPRCPVCRAPVATDAADCASCGYPLTEPAPDG